MMEATLMHTLLWATGAALLGSVIFSLVGLISGTSETATISPAVLLVVLMGFPRPPLSRLPFRRLLPSTSRTLLPPP